MRGRGWLMKGGIFAAIFLFVFCTNVSHSQADQMKSDIIANETASLVREKRWVHHLMVGVQGVALSTGLVSSTLSITDYAIGGHLYAWDIPESNRRIQSAIDYMMSRKDEIEDLRQSYKKTYETYENAHIYYNQYVMSQNIVMDLINHKALDEMRQTLIKDSLRADLIENGINIKPQYQVESVAAKILTISSLSVSALGNFLFGKSLFKTLKLYNMKVQDLGIAVKTITLDGIKKNVVQLSNPKISQNPKYRDSSIKNARGQASFDIIDSNGNIVGNKLITIMDEFGVIQEFQTPQAAKEARAAHLKSQGLKEVPTTNKSLKQRIGSLGKGIKGLFRGLSSKTLASKNSMAFDPTTAKTKTPLRASKAATNLAVLSLGITIATMYQSIDAQQTRSAELALQAAQMEAHKKEVDNLLTHLPANISAMENSIEEMVDIVGYLLETNQVKCHLTKDNLLPVLREMANNGKRLMKHIVKFTENYDSIRFQIEDNMYLGGKGAFEKISRRYPNMTSTIVKLLKESGLVHFEWSEFAPLNGINSKCFPICGISLRKMKRSCIRGDCFGRDIVEEYCGEFDQDAYNMCKKTGSLRNDFGFRGVGSFLPAVCKSHVDPINHTYYSIINEATGMALTINQNDSRSLIVTSNTGADNQLWRVENGSLICKYYGRTLGSGFDGWKYENKRIRNSGENLTLVVVPCLNSKLESRLALAEEFSGQVDSCQQWRMEQLVPITSLGESTTMAPQTTTDQPKTIDEFLSLMNLSSLLPNFVDKGVTLDMLPQLLLPEIRETVFNELGITNFLYKMKIISGAKKYLA